VKDTIILELNQYEKGIIVNALNDKRTELIKNNEDTYLIDELLLKIFETPEKKRPFVKRLVRDERRYC
jgi:hypothetical protein